ncbi:Alpha/Beta hydrolase protein [Penicillium canariense]|uniref:Carboxylic ester hydrolase n=1 Tax=Penicillium canariense TaxID=189055 RepID=A0A9W9HRI0_9EURO|nr:Alpha/Beta hydrolase protein [Penicillium canariense]KAJ5153480.1 Alpha/Beta hydrolase protein [Penicillium canariense]
MHVLWLVPFTTACALATVVDLGYTLHNSTVVNAIDGFAYLNFSNIRYAAAPTGAHRFQLPQPPKVDRSVQNGLPDVICPQAQPAWMNTAFEVLSGGTPTGADWGNFTASDIPPADPRTSEDCLFLDLLVPETTFSNKDTGKKSPVLLFIHGGGFVEGSKAAYGYGDGLLESDFLKNHGDIIYISINYRLGLFRFALQWVQQYVHLFGGDPDNVTIMGESAGGGSIMNHITAYDGKDSEKLFSKAIVQSPWSLYTPKITQEEVLKSVLSTANVTTVEDLRKISSDSLQTANALVVGNARPYATFAFGPVVDGSFVTDLPSRLLADGKFRSSVKLMTGHNSDEGIFFASPYIKTNDDYKSYLAALFRTLSPSQIGTVSEQLYPAKFDGSFGYTDELGRVSLTLADATIVCNARYLDEAIHESYAYEFSVPPGIHSADLPYTFHDSMSGVGVNVSLAELMQAYFTEFSTTGSPDGPGLPPFPKDADWMVQNFNSTNFGPMKDPASAKRCAWWQMALGDERERERESCKPGNSFRPRGSSWRP